jgi:dihydroorotate dehydrogenase
MARVPKIIDAADVPVIAAGGIANGQGIAGAFVLGASGVQMGFSAGVQITLKTIGGISIVVLYKAPRQVLNMMVRSHFC